jgi:hypothetical protein
MALFIELLMEEHGRLICKYAFAGFQKIFNIKPKIKSNFYGEGLDITFYSYFQW